MVVFGSSPPRAANVLVRQVVGDECVAVTTPYARELFLRCGSAPRGQAAASDHGWPLQVIDDAAHAPHIETPERFVTALATLLDDQPTGNGLA